jgi:hypothetical protein
MNWLAPFSAFLSCIPPASLSYAGQQRSQSARSASYLFIATRCGSLCFDFCSSCGALSHTPSSPTAEPPVQPAPHARMLPCTQPLVDARCSLLSPALFYNTSSSSKNDWLIAGRAVLHPPLPMASDNHFSTEEACIDQMGSHAHHNSFAAGVPDQLRRDGALAHTATGMLSNAITSRYSAPRPDAT